MARIKNIEPFSLNCQAQHLNPASGTNTPQLLMEQFLFVLSSPLLRFGPIMRHIHIHCCCIPTQRERENTSKRKKKFLLCHYLSILRVQTPARQLSSSLYLALACQPRSVLTSLQKPKMHLLVPNFIRSATERNLQLTVTCVKIVNEPLTAFDLNFSQASHKFCLLIIFSNSFVCKIFLMISLCFLCCAKYEPQMLKA
jgi:hypothetical protein